MSSTWHCAEPNPRAHPTRPDNRREPVPGGAMTAIVDTDRAAAEMLHSALGPETVVLTSLEALRHHLETNPADDVVVLSSAVDLYSALALAESLRVSRPSLGVILLRRRVDTSVLHDALRAGVREVVDERDLRHHDRRTPGPGGRPRDARTVRQRRRPGWSPPRTHRHRLQRQGRLWQDDTRHQPGRRARRARTARGVHRRPRSRLRRRCRRPAGFDPSEPSPTPSRWPTRSTAPHSAPC